jgi:BirA family biotin operon repressor/biotin-[acetyl-CoA-carboxylase] ligase
MILADRGPGREVRAADLPAPERGLWEALGGGHRLFLGDDALPGDGFWWRLAKVRSAAASQFDALSKATEAGLRLPGPVAARAGEGRGFHGLRGRSWAARPGNLHLAAAIPLADFPAAAAIGLTLLPALAATDAIREASAGRVRPGLKWVNDLLLDGRKVGGVLTGTRLTGARVEIAFVGIGVNVTRVPEVVPTPFVPAAGAVPEVGLETLTDALLRSIAARTRQLLADGSRPLLDGYRAASVIVGRAVRVYPEGIDDEAPPERWPPPLATGVVRGIRDDLSLEIEGHPEPVSRGRLAFEEACAAHGLPPL